MSIEDIIIYEDNDIIALNKPAGIATQTSRLAQKDLYSEVKNYLKGGFAGIINRLDQPVRGIVLMGKTKEATADLEKQIATGKTDKYYRAEVYVGDKESPVNITHSLTDYMCKVTGGNLSEICSKEADGAKEARLEYRVIQKQDKKAILDIHLLTGRHHQIRLQLSHAGMPILGDTKYGSLESKQYSLEHAINNVQLCAYKYIFSHPKTKERIELIIEP